MSFSQLPDRMAGYVTYELTEKLAKLTAPQRAAIDRIVQHVYIQNLPWADLFRGDDRICAENKYYRKGHIDEATGKRKGFGWGHNPDFIAALDEARKLAIGADKRERLWQLERAKRFAAMAAAPAVQTLVNVMAFSPDDAARIKAAEKVIEFAFETHGQVAESASSEEADWWAAAGNDK